MCGGWRVYSNRAVVIVDLLVILSIESFTKKIWARKKERFRKQINGEIMDNLPVE